MPFPGEGIGEFSALEQWQIEEIKKGLDEADQGEFASDQEVEQSLKHWLRGSSTGNC
jgi:RHH-type rel operon transcriptional repressor/antitoxin RelB